MFSLKIDSDLELALIDPSFAPTYYNIVCEQKDYLSQWLPWVTYANSEEFFTLFIKQSLHDYADGKCLPCAMVFQGEVVGNIDFNAIAYPLKKVQIGYWISQPYQGKGIVSRSVSKLIDHAFEKLDMERVQVTIAAENTRSRKLCERLGFQLHGIFPNYENLNGQIVDHAVYTVCRQQRLDI